MILTEEQKQAMCDLIEESLLNATLNGLIMEDDGGGYPLVDFLSFENDHTILSGKEEINNLVEQIYFDMEDWDI